MALLLLSRLPNVDSMIWEAKRTECQDIASTPPILFRCCDVSIYACNDSISWSSWALDASSISCLDKLQRRVCFINKSLARERGIRNGPYNIRIKKTPPRGAWFRPASRGSAVREREAESQGAINRWGRSPWPQPHVDPWKSCDCRGYWGGCIVLWDITECKGWYRVAKDCGPVGGDAGLWEDTGILDGHCRGPQIMEVCKVRGLPSRLWRVTGGGPRRGRSEAKRS